MNHRVLLDSFSRPSARLVSHGLWEVKGWSSAAKAQQCEAVKRVANTLESASARGPENVLTIWSSLGKLRDDYSAEAAGKEFNNEALESNRACQLSQGESRNLCMMDVWKLSNETGRGSCHGGGECEGWAGWSGDGYHYEFFVYNTQLQMMFNAISSSYGLAGRI